MSDCCSGSSCETDTKAMACQTCGQEAKKVDDLTVKALLKEGLLYDFKPDIQYFYCKTAGCDTVYFTDLPDSVFTQKDIKTESASKSENKEAYVCFCFGHTAKEIENEVRSKGESDLYDQISEQTKLKNCACELKNPSGKCCLGEVKRVVKDTLTSQKRPVTALST